ncbi:MAG: hypothetical protein ABWX76_11440 [Leifsonia flava]
MAPRFDEDAQEDAMTKTQKPTPRSGATTGLVVAARLAAITE